MKKCGGGERRGEERYYNLLVQAAVNYTAQWTMTPIKITLVTRYQRGNVYFLDNEYGGVQQVQFTARSKARFTDLEARFV